ncbi:hypothetical protein SI65_09789 [Aspergillus cristatus]|uniref:Uncharacterized protein n=1 Tax=Aspergillus cristatus TaxID=573508 RepID=A0A1E3B1J2_ASPCR|nr:hypothetical protein SI65_09789 [Aspergillus cristatus]
MGPLECEPKFPVFTHQSNKPLRPGSGVMTTIRGSLQNCREEARGAILVMNGWDGLSTDPMSLVKSLSAAWSVTRDTSRKPMGGQLFRFSESLTLRRSNSPFCTEGFVEEAHAIGSAKKMISKSLDFLWTESKNRNTPPEVKLTEGPHHIESMNIGERTAMVKPPYLDNTQKLHFDDIRPYHVRQFDPYHREEMPAMVPALEMDRGVLAMAMTLGQRAVDLYSYLGEWGEQKPLWRFWEVDCGGWLGSLPRRTSA